MSNRKVSEDQRQMSLALENEELREVLQLQREMMGQLTALLHSMGPSPDRMWTTEDIANYCGFKVRWVQMRMKEPGFPAAIQIPDANGNPGPKRFVASEIIKWALKYRAFRYQPSASA